MNEQAFECQRCGKCCFEIGEEMEVPKELQAEWKRRGWDWALYWIDEDLNEIWPTNEGKCPFLWKVRYKNIYYCRVHEAKPPACKEFPGPYEDGTMNAWALKNCPGVKALKRDQGPSAEAEEAPRACEEAVQVPAAEAGPGPSDRMWLGPDFLSVSCPRSHPSSGF